MPLPVAADSSAGDADRESAVSSTNAGSGHRMTAVAIVEDDAVLRRSIRSLLLGERGMTCACACGTGEEALRLVPRVAADIVIMDIRLPGMSGIECTRLLKQECPALPVLMLTVYDDTDLIFDALRAGATGFLLKRSISTELLRAIEDVLEGGSPMTSQVARRVVDSFRGPAKADEELQLLTEREWEILNHLSRGYSNKEIGEKLFIGVPTVRTHLRHIYEKLHVRSRTEAALKFRGRI